MADITITTEDFNAEDEINALRLAGVGAIVTFTGIVRDKAEHPDLIAMTLEHFPGMTEQEIQTIIDQGAGTLAVTGGQGHSPCWPVAATGKYCLCRHRFCSPPGRF